MFKTISDQYVGQISMFKVVSGTVGNDDHPARRAHAATDERLHGLFHLRGGEQVPGKQLVAGDIGAVAKLDATGTGEHARARTTNR